MPAYQPETAYEIFIRALFNKDVATGTVDLFDEYSTVGPSTTWHIKNEVFPAPEPVCYILDANSRCTENQWNLVNNGTAIVKNYVVVGIVEEEEDEDEEARQSSVLDLVLSKVSLLQSSVQKVLNGRVSWNREGRTSTDIA